MPNKSYAYLLNVHPNNLVFLKTYNTQFDEIIITFTDQNCQPLEIENKVNLTLLITRTYVKGYRFLSFDIKTIFGYKTTKNSF